MFHIFLNIFDILIYMFDMLIDISICLLIYIYRSYIYIYDLVWIIMARLVVSITLHIIQVGFAQTAALVVLVQTLENMEKLCGLASGDQKVRQRT